jgi:hypothetical protein
MQLVKDQTSKVPALLAKAAFTARWKLHFEQLCSHNLGNHSEIRPLDNIPQTQATMMKLFVALFLAMIAAVTIGLSKQRWLASSTGLAPRLAKVELIRTPVSPTAPAWRTTTTLFGNP